MGNNKEPLVMIGNHLVPLVMLALVLSGTIMCAGCTNVIPSDTKESVMDAISPWYVVKYSPQYYRAYPNESSINVTENATANATANETIIHATQLPTIAPTEIITPVSVEPTATVHYIDPYSGGERYEGMWYRWTWHNASGLQDANRGIIIYKHLYLDSLTYWDDAWGNYFTQTPPFGYRYLAIFAHEEDFGPDDNGVWGYQNTSFYLTGTGNANLDEMLTRLLQEPLSHRI